MALGEDGAGCELLSSTGVISALILHSCREGFVTGEPRESPEHVWLTP